MLDKRERLPREDLVNAIFGIYQTATHFTLKQLTEKTQQPQVWLKEVLGELCNLNKRGPKTGTYELKPEFIANVAQDS